MVWVSQSPDTQAANDFLSSQGLQGTIAMPAVTIHAPPIATATPTTEERRACGACGAEWGVQGGCGRAVIRTYIIGHIGVHPLAAVHAEIAINQICQSNQKNRRPK